MEGEANAALAFASVNVLYLHIHALQSNSFPLPVYGILPLTPMTMARTEEDRVGVVHSFYQPCAEFSFALFMN